MGYGEKEISPEEEAAISGGFGGQGEGLLSAADLESDPRSLRVRGVEGEPRMTDPAWPGFVMRQFEEDELDPEGCPLVHGLRRVARLLLGPVLVSQTRVVQAPGQGPATAEHTLQILVDRDADGAAYPATFGDCADVHAGNADPEFARHATATASTRAEARCYRKALLLRKVSAEEKTRIPFDEPDPDGPLKESQINFIHNLCRRLDVDVMKYLAQGRKKYKKIEDVTYAVAQVMAEHLNSFQADPSKIKASIKGFKPDWRGK